MITDCRTPSLAGRQNIPHFYDATHLHANVCRFRNLPTADVTLETHLFVWEATVQLVVLLQFRRGYSIRSWEDRWTRGDTTILTVLLVGIAFKKKTQR